MRVGAAGLVAFSDLTIDQVAMLVASEPDIHKVAPILQAEEFSGRKLCRLESVDELMEELPGTKKSDARILWDCIVQWKQQGVDATRLT